MSDLQARIDALIAALDEFAMLVNDHRLAQQAGRDTTSLEAQLSEARTGVFDELGAYHRAVKETPQ